MKVDQIALQAAGKSLGSTRGLSSGFGGAGISWLVRDDLAGATQPGADDAAAFLGFDAEPPPPISFSFLPQPGTGSFPTILIEDYGSGLPKSGSPSVASFAGGPGGGHGGGGSGGGPLTPYTPAPQHNMTFIINWDSSVASAPAGFTTGFKTAVDYFLNNLTGPDHSTTITLSVGWGEAGGASLPLFALGESLTNIEQVSYDKLKSAMYGYLPSVHQLPLNNPFPVNNGNNPIIWVPTAEEEALGLGVQNTTQTSDGAVGFSSRVNWNFTNTTTTGGKYDFVSVAKHEISEAMGRIALLGGAISDGGVNIPNGFTPFDLFRYSNPGTRSFTGGQAAYFSFDDGNSSGANNLAQSNVTNFNTIAGGDYGDWASSAGKDAYNASANTGVSYTTSNVDTLVMDVLGYGHLPTPT